MRMTSSPACVNAVHDAKIVASPIRARQLPATLPMFDQSPQQFHGDWTRWSLLIPSIPLR